MKVKIVLLTSNIFIFPNNVGYYARWVGKYDNGGLYLKDKHDFINGDDLTQEDFELLGKEQDKGLLKIVEIVD